MLTLYGAFGHFRKGGKSQAPAYSVSDKGPCDRLKPNRGMLIRHGPPSYFGPYHAIAVVWEGGKGMKTRHPVLGALRQLPSPLLVQQRYLKVKRLKVFGSDMATIPMLVHRQPWVGTWVALRLQDLTHTLKRETYLLLYTIVVCHLNATNSFRPSSLRET